MYLEEFSSVSKLSLLKFSSVILFFSILTLSAFLVFLFFKVLLLESQKLSWEVRIYDLKYPTKNIFSLPIFFRPFLMSFLVYSS